MNQEKEYILTKQCIRSATSVGANISEAQRSQSRKDFISKLSISMKESYETRYWLNLLSDTTNCNKNDTSDLLRDLHEIISMMGSSIATAKRNLITKR